MSDSTAPRPRGSGRRSTEPPEKTPREAAPSRGVESAGNLAALLRRAVLGRRQGEALDAGRDVEPGLALDVERLQGNALVGAADQHAGADAAHDRRAAGHAAVAARQRPPAPPARPRDRP